MNINTPISLGELVDKITILQIKKQKIKEETKLKNINIELELLIETLKQTGLMNQLVDYTLQLQSVNLNLWNCEDVIRDCERQKLFDSTFVETARSIYKYNDQRSIIKKEINLQFGSTVVEEKSYSE